MLNRGLVKDSIFLKIDIFIQERFNKLIFSINTIIKCGIIYQFIQPLMDNKMSIFEEYGAFKVEYLVINSGFLQISIETCCGYSLDEPQWII